MLEHPFDTRSVCPVWTALASGGRSVTLTLLAAPTPSRDGVFFRRTGFDGPAPRCSPPRERRNGPGRVRRAGRPDGSGGALLRSGQGVSPSSPWPARGSVTRKVAPPPGVGRYSTRPRWAVTMASTMDSPSPVPLYPVRLCGLVRAGSPR
ncbi:hypothetical protein SAMN05444320_11122 [Streptoalloteichus hindustanus]|uniref:Uncharacterized protein n=1 Tax=Streptoalloteichus hindustanus TaxID=2017 RepID=A0A1M5L8F3_STRHI|nr:hypothetical protein SAMN05444320_11122 [Streptoalloteichus hindustanus]